MDAAPALSRRRFPRRRDLRDRGRRRRTLSAAALPPTPSLSTGGDTVSKDRRSRVMGASVDTRIELQGAFERQPSRATRWPARKTCSRGMRSKITVASPTRVVAQTQQTDAVASAHARLPHSQQRRVLRSPCPAAATRRAIVAAHLRPAPIFRRYGEGGRQLPYRRRRRGGGLRPRPPPRVTLCPSADPPRMKGAVTHPPERVATPLGLRGSTASSVGTRGFFRRWRWRRGDVGHSYDASPKTWGK